MLVQPTDSIPVYPMPFVKWAGGKGQLLDFILPLIPSFADYYEPFVGGGALYLALWRRRQISQAYLNDINHELMTAYEVLQSQPESLCDALHVLVSDYYANSSRESFYYSLRSTHPEDSVDIAARFIFLNKTGYNGLYRVNRQGRFNVPVGRYKNPSIYNRTNLLAVSQALQTAHLSCTTFIQATAGVQAGDLVYFDPPYHPVSKTSNFTAYTSTGFSFRDQEVLAAEFDRLANIGAMVILSNSDADLVARLYEGKGYRIVEVEATRRINSDITKRGNISELIVHNLWS